MTNTDRSNNSNSVRETASCEPINDIYEVPHFEYNYPASRTDFTVADKSATKRKASDNPRSVREPSDKESKVGSSIASKGGSRGGSSIDSKGRASIASSVASTNLISKDWKRSESSVRLNDMMNDMMITENDDENDE